MWSFTILTMMMKLDEISKTLVINSAMMQLIAQEDFSTFICIKT
jgi:hypothetical protein